MQIDKSLTASLRDQIMQRCSWRDFTDELLSDQQISGISHYIAQLNELQKTIKLHFITNAEPVF